MRMYDLIMKKKENQELSKEEIDWMIQGYTKGIILDYQMSAMLMAICFTGLTPQETLHLTMAMKNSGDNVDLSAIPGIKVDKHSTGGVGDKTTLILAPMIASLGVPVAKMSGRGLGHTGGTIDKLESFPGFHTSIEESVFVENVNKIHIAVAGQTANLVPADKKLYALRDTTATVNQMSLIASSIMSKKLASGADAIVLDVKTGSGAFMKSYQDAFALAQEMVSLGKNAQKKTAAIITNMDQPLGNAVGNIIEVEEAIAALNGQGPKDLMEVVYALGSRMLLFAQICNTKEQAYEKMQQAIANKSALQKLAELVKYQGGDETYVYYPDKFPKANIVRKVLATENGYVSHINSEAIGHACMSLGGGRAAKEDSIDLTVGIYLYQKVGAKVAKNEALACVYGNNEEQVSQAEHEVLSAYQIDKKPCDDLPVIFQEIL